MLFICNAYGKKGDRALTTMNSEKKRLSSAWDRPLMSITHIHPSILQPIHLFIHIFSVPIIDQTLP